VPGQTEVDAPERRVRDGRATLEVRAGVVALGRDGHAAEELLVPRCEPPPIALRSANSGARRTARDTISPATLAIVNKSTSSDAPRKK